MYQADVESRRDAHSCGDRMVGGLQCAGSPRSAGSDGTHGFAFGPSRSQTPLFPTPAR